MNFKEANGIILSKQEHEYEWYELPMEAYKAFGVIVFKPLCETCARRNQCAIALDADVEKCNFYVDESRSIKVVED